MRRIVIGIGLATAMLSGCATPESRIESKLIAAGLSKRNAKCMAHELTDRLSWQQLRTLDRLAKDARNSDRLGRLTIGELAERLQRAGDPKLIVAVSRAGLGCAILG